MDVSAVPPLLVLHYAGSRPLSVHYWRDAFAENVHMAGLFDQRDLEEFVGELEATLREWTVSPRVTAASRG